jgi:hypothetical protein
VEVLAPDPGGAAVASFKDDRRTARAAALYVQPAATPNVNEAREVTLRGVGHWRGGARGAKADGKQQDGDGQGRGRMTKRTHDRLPWLSRGAYSCRPQGAVGVSRSFHLYSVSVLQAH